MARFLKVIIFCLFFPLVLYPQSQDIKFEHISVEQGLSHGDIHGILQDHQGFMWFATEDGLNKYDGYRMSTFRHDLDDSTSLGSNFIRSLYEDSSGELWISTTGGGLNKFNREKENFIRYVHDPDNPESINCNSMEQTIGYQYNGKDVLWIGSGNGLNKMDIASKKFTHYPHSDKGFPHSSVETTLIDSSGHVWIGCSKGGLYKFDPESIQFTHYQHNPSNPNSLSDNTVMHIYEDKSGIFWIGTRYGGLNKFDPKKNQFVQYQHDPNNPRSLSSNLVMQTYEDRTGILWIATADGGLNIFNRGTEQFTHYHQNHRDPNSLSDNSVKCIYEDKSGVIWVGTWSGVNKIDPQKSQFSDYKQSPDSQNILANSFIASICESTYRGKKVLWVSPKAHGLYKIDRDTGKSTHYLNDPNNPKSLPSNRITALLDDQASILWIGTWGDGLIKFESTSEKFNQYLINPNNSNSTNLNIIRTIFKDKRGVLWIGTHSGLFKFYTETEQFIKTGIDGQVHQVYEDKLGVIWVATLRGFKKLDWETDQFATFRHNPDDPNSISTNQISSIYEDTSGIIWIGTFGGGLNKFDRKSEEFINYTVNNGLPNNDINGILEDMEGNLWLSTNGGLSKFNPGEEKFRNYDVNDGLPGNQFFPGACFKSKNDKMFFGSAKGLVAFYPNNLHNNPYIPEIVITDFQISNTSVSIIKEGYHSNNDIYTLPKTISLLEKIELSYKENIFSFEFAALDFHSPKKNRYAYILEGFEKVWNFTGANKRFATYTNLDPGEYVFRVKGSNNDDLWNEDGKSIKIIITPPWWKTNLAYTFYILAIGLIIVGVWRFQTNRIKMKHELDLEHVRAERLEEVDQMKSRFFANISHEFRTPLTLIKGPVRQMLSDEFTGNMKEQFKMILRNSDRLLNLINQLLDLSKLESGRMKLQVTNTDLIQFMKGLVFSFSSLAERKKISLKFKTDNDSFHGYIDRDKTEKIITNLLSNAFKFTPESGEVILECGLRNADSKIQNPKSKIPSSQFKIQNSEFRISISNTGPGIQPDQLDKIFDRFYQTEDNYKKDSEGSGIGLALTKELVEACHGEISVSSILNKTTTFFITLPVSKEYFREDELSNIMLGHSFTERDNFLVLETEKHLPINQKIQTAKSAPLLLIVEDNPDVISYICSFMENDYQLITAENGNIGLKKTLDKYPDLIISDVMMPEIDGFELCNSIKTDQRTSHIPVILLTAKADLDSKIEGLEFGADDYICKPFEADELKIRVKNLIELRQKLKDRFQKELKINPTEVTSNSMDEIFFEKICTIVEQHINDAHLTAEKLANECNVSHRSLNRKLNALTGYSARKFISTMRLKRAAQLLQNNTDTVSQIAYQVGFRNLSYFTQIFRHQFNTTPAQYRNHFQVSS